MKIAKTNNTNYKKWSFRLFLYLIITNIAIAYLVINYAIGIHDSEIFERNLGILSIVANFILLIGIILIILSITNKEKKDYQFYISIIGYPLFLITTLLSFF